jgi:hypothetical protein
MKTPIAAVLGAVLLFGCAADRSNSKPDWVDGPSAKYGDTQFLIGRGQASNQEEAKDRARADLAKIFEVSINVETADTQTYKSAGAKGKTETQSTSQVSRTIATRTDQIIQGVKIAEIWQQPATKTYYALAVLPRLQAANSLRQEIERLDTATQNDIQQARNNPDLLIKIAAASRALNAQVQRQSYQKSLKILDRTGLGLEPQWNIGKLTSDLDALLKRVHIAARISPDSPGELGTMLSGGLSTAGFLTETGQNPDYLMEASLQLNDLGIQDSWHWFRGTLEIKLSEQANGRIRGTKRWDIKSSGQQQTVARQRAIEQVDAILKKDLYGAIIGFVTN